MEKILQIYTEKTHSKLKKVDLSATDFSDSNFTKSIFTDCNLQDSVFLRTNFCRCVFKSCNLSNSLFNDCNFFEATFIDCNIDRASLFGADLVRSKFINSNIINCDIRFSVGNMVDVKTILVANYHISFNNKFLAIGCRQYTHQQWYTMSDHTISLLAEGALDWWQKWKDFIFMAIMLEYNTNYEVTGAGEDGTN